ncbi:unnamed protein product [Adineta steineri]|uniref:Uncharacterized protein n=1 Tax=Adineta steineri TaxID=433720 RepID=A0A819X3R4_9BILA|nr:unnamed protein product [Adineta steineri]CAF1512615.1 unnamed protein product [Adineta steineri]CAF4136214.1 unnamed protein product [Adineta steineri]
MDKNLFKFLCTYGEFSVYNHKNYTPIYKIKSSSGSSEKQLEIIANPSKQVVGKLKREWIGKTAVSTFEVFDNKTQQWKTGKFFKLPKVWTPDISTIEWDEEPLQPVIVGFMHHGNFQNSRDITLAQFQRKGVGKGPQKEYYVYVYSNDVPDLVYLFYIACMDM